LNGKRIIHKTWHYHNESGKEIPPRYEEPRHHKKACHKKKPCGKPKRNICVVKPCQPRITCRPITTKTTTTTTTTTTTFTTTATTNNKFFKIYLILFFVYKNKSIGKCNNFIFK
jgi:hypothetical protein